ncbi:SAM-dependent methyltransferase [Gardnerella sp. Marseille-Q2328]|uniref:THUMP-like domain-containing protein n=1 Tax=Gardnerella sp. Marseille-Q2328 TaxID=2759694 RepID=UPI0020253AB1|nr:SAM-dependent methyltransferase [Gardnerella sp. Marseille-Q2328]
MPVLQNPPAIQPANDSTIAFIKENSKANPNNAALKAPRNAGIDVPFAINQIAGKQIALQKLPKWASCEEIIYPAHISMEQCSSQATAQYKANIAQKLLSELHEENTSSTLVDLTGGFGVDCTIMSEVFDSAICIEQQTELSSIAQHNMKSLGLSHVACYNNNSLDALNHISNVTMIYVDPARRNTQGARTYAIEDCTPDVLALKGSMLAKAQIVMIKLSPMLDWHKTVSDFGGNVSQVHIVAHNNECKELLLIIDAHIHNQLSIHCVNDNQRTTIKAFYDTVTKQVSTRAAQSSDNTAAEQSNDLRNWQQWAQYVYEPNAAVMKAGCFEYLEEQYKIQEIGPNSHVCIARDYYADFPGKVWKIESTCSMNKRDIKQTLGDLTHANIVTRNFPMPAEVLKKRLHLQDGGNIRLIATTDSNKDHVIIRAGSVQQ